MRLLLSNDDGVEAAGLLALAEGLQDEHEVWVVAPASERSAMSHSLTMHKPLRVRRMGERRWSVSGTPADCVYIGLHQLMAQAKPDLVLSGVNYGSNLGSDVHYSGTVAAAREACLAGFPSIALSLHYRPLAPGLADPDDETLHWTTAVSVARQVIAGWMAATPPPRVFLNVNIPNVPPDKLRGVRACRLGERVYEIVVDERLDPRGRPYVWIGGPHVRFGTESDTDGPLVETGHATVTPLSADLTNDPELVRLHTWVEQR